MARIREDLVVPHHREARPLPYFTLDRELHMMELFEDFFRDRESESMSCATRSCLVDFVESIEYVKQVFFRYSNAVISDNESILREDDIDNSTLLGEFLCIGDDIAHCREEEFWIDDTSDLCFLMPDDPRIIISDMRLEELHASSPIAIMFFSSTSRIGFSGVRLSESRDRE